MKKKYLFLSFLLLAYFPVESQINLSVYAEVSIVTAGPGKELYEAFGHSAIRIKDPVLQLDLIYNYGIFDFNAPNFYQNFTKGKLLYNLGRYDFKYFVASYKRDKRWVKQQILNLTQKEKQAFFSYLEKNALPQNTSYLYDPYYNNCATKLRDITLNVLGKKVTFNDTHLEKNQSLRQLMAKELPWNTWGSFGINLALGSKLDKTATPLQYMYLPDYVFSAYKNASVFIKNQPEKLIKKEETVLDFKELKQSINLFNPFCFFLIITFLGLFITYKDYKNTSRSKWFDFILFFTTGLIGILIVFLWFFTNHSTTPNNFNFLWAFAPNMIVAFLLLKEKHIKWVSQYLFLLLFFILMIPIIWLSKIQELPLSIIPFLVLLMIRYLFLYKRLLPLKK